MNIKRKIAPAILIASLVLLATATQIHAGVITLSAVNSGWYTDGGIQNGTVGNFNADATAAGVQTRNNWLGFDLSSVTDTIVSATLEVSSDSSNASGQLFTWSEVSTAYGSLGNVNGVGIFSDLGSGTVFGQGTHTAGTLNSFTLTAAGIASLNAAPSFWATGGSHNGSGGVDAFGFTGGVPGDHINLVLTTAAVPEPASLAIFGTICLLGFSRRRKS